MTTIREVLDVLENYFPLKLQEQWDNSGLQIGDITQVVSGVLCAIDITEKVIDEAIENKCNLIISHHPLLFHPLKVVDNRSYINRCVIKAIKNDICIYSAHTNADNSLYGLNFAMGERLGLTKMAPIYRDISNDKYNGGVIGELEDSILFFDFLNFLKNTFDWKILTYSPTNNKEVRKVAICTGAGAFMQKKATELGADVFITGEAKYNDYLDSVDGATLVCAGHYETEIISQEIFSSIIMNNFINFAVITSKEIVNPINIF